MKYAMPARFCIVAFTRSMKLAWKLRECACSKCLNLQYVAIGARVIHLLALVPFQAIGRALSIWMMQLIKSSHTQIIRLLKA